MDVRLRTRLISALVSARKAFRFGETVTLSGRPDVHMS